MPPPREHALTGAKRRASTLERDFAEGRIREILARETPAALGPDFYGPRMPTARLRAFSVSQSRRTTKFRANCQGSLRRALSVVDCPGTTQARFQKGTRAPLNASVRGVVRCAA